MVKKEQQSSTNNNQLENGAIELLKNLIATPSFSKVEDASATVIEQYLKEHSIETHRFMNNVWAVNQFYDPNKPTLLLNSHHDTVKPNPGYTIDPFLPIEENGKLYGLGSNDAGASLVSLLSAFIYFYKEKNPVFNLIMAATAEEEISGSNGVEALLPLLPNIDAAIVGEPTQMQMAVAERGLMVLDCVAHGRAGHAARNEGENSIYKAMKDIDWMNWYRFEKISEMLGPVKMNVTSIETSNKAHNVVPSECNFVVDVRINEMYSMDEILDKISANIQSKIKPRSTRLKSTSISKDHPLVAAGLILGRTCYGSPTTSDKALMSFPALKMGPGDSARSHTADEFIFIEEIRNGIDLYIQLLNKVKLFDLKNFTNQQTGNQQSSTGNL